MNFSTTCLRYSKFISLESFKSELLVTVTEALGTSEFARSSGTSLSGLIFYRKIKNPQRKKRSTLQMLLAWHWEGSGFRISEEIVPTGGHKLGIHSSSSFMGHSREVSPALPTPQDRSWLMSVFCVRYPNQHRAGSMVETVPWQFSPITNLFWAFQTWAFFRIIFNIRAKPTILKPLLIFF